MNCINLQVSSNSSNLLFLNWTLLKICNLKLEEIGCKTGPEMATLILISKNLVFHNLVQISKSVVDIYMVFNWINYSFIFKYWNHSCLFKQVLTSLYSTNLNWNFKLSLRLNLFNWCLSCLKSNYLLFSHKIFSMLVRTALFYDRAVYKMKKLRYPCHLKRESE